MKEQIEKLETQLKELKKVYENQEKIKYEIGEHKHFEVGDIVTNGNTIAIVKWTENKAMGFEYEKGYFGGSMINGNRGFGSYRRDEFEIVNDDYYNAVHHLSIPLTGLEIEDIKYCLGHRNMNPNESKSKILDYLDSIR